ncbi:unnamed protein product [Agarophyton chilense]|eukprot:gb/GEZJ01003172.1/.p1 GENE.gb/GEZJ01003172.1/~~gb/GEZJ01003172.1/.p1  ORF type:complete len:577 (-),score=81.10 gb/GEZJ01003172.1/:1808-3322(-)
MMSNMRTIPRLARVRQCRSFAATPETPLMWKLTHGMFDPETSMTEKFPNIPDPADIEAPSPGTVEISALPNGVRVASQDMGSPVAAIGFFVGAGSRNETPYSSGVSHLIERLAYKGSTMRTKYRMTRDMERTGALFAASAARETIAFSAEGMRDKLPEMLSIITETAVAPVTTGCAEGSPDWDIAMEEITAQTTVMKDELKSFASEPNGQVTEAIHAAAFHGNTLGLPLVAEERKLPLMNPTTVSDFVSDNFTPDKMVISAANVDHAALVELSESLLGELSGESVLNASRYTGGSVRISSDGPGQVAIGFQGVSWQDDDLVPVCVLHTLLGGGGSFSSGGPGKGMYTRLYSEILNKHGWVSAATAFNHCYSDGGLFGIHGVCEDPAHLNNLIEVVGLQVGKLASPLVSGELERAKMMTKSSLIMNLESRAVVCEDLGRQILCSGRYAGPKELIKKIDAVTEDDIRRVASRMIQSQPAVVTYGEEYATYEYAAIESSLKRQTQLA